MGIYKGNTSNKLLPVAKYSIISPDGVTTMQEVTMDTSWKYAWWLDASGQKRKGELFHIGGGNPNVAEAAHQYDYGTYTFTPQNDFLGLVQMWGAGGGGYNSGDSSSKGGGGGYTQGLMLFKANTPYALTIGQAGRYAAGGGTVRNVTTHGGGGGAQNLTVGGQGGGLTGVFMNSTHRGRAAWAYNPPVRQQQALLIAGGGGGTGHHNTGSHHGSGGGGGGWVGRNGHNSGGGGQSYGGHYNTYSSGTGWLNGMGMPLHGGNSSYQDTWCGGGGGGWYGGGGGAHSGSHYNGGGGGSGHHASKQDTGIFPNSGLSKFIMYANTEIAPSGHDQPWQYSANYKTPLAYRSGTATVGEYDGLYAGKGGLGSTEPLGRSAALHGKIIVTLMPEFMATNYFRDKGVTHPNTTEWTNQDDYTTN